MLRRLLLHCNVADVPHAGSILLRIHYAPLLPLAGEGWDEGTLATAFQRVPAGQGTASGRSNPLALTLTLSRKRERGNKVTTLSREREREMEGLGDQRQRRSIVKIASQPPSTHTPARFQPHVRPSTHAVFEIWRDTNTRLPRPVSTWHML